MPQDGERLDPIAAIAAAVLPGLGYIINKRFKRGIYTAVGILGLFTTGIAVGGLDAIDSREDRLWFIAQACTGPIAFAADYIHQNRFKVPDQDTGPRHPTPAQWDAGRTGDGPYYARPAIGKVDDAAALLTALAGMMNLIAIIDCASPKPRHEQTPSSPAAKRRRKDHDPKRPGHAA